MTSINDAGVLAGWYGDNNGNNHSYVATPNGLGGYGFAMFNAQGADSTFINGINNAGQFVGSVDVNGVFYGFGGRLSTGATPIEVPGSTYTFAFGLNNAGTAVGRYSVIGPSSGMVAGFVTTDNGKTFTSLSDPSASNDTEAYGINSQGTIAGTYRTADTNFHGFLATPGSNGAYSYSTFDVPGAVTTYLRGINDLGQVVGSTADAAGRTHGFVGTSNGSGYTFQALDDPLATGGTSILGINNAGQVVGYYFDAAGNQHGFVATPSAVPEPTSLAMLGVGLAGIGLAARRRRA